MISSESLSSENKNNARDSVYLASFPLPLADPILGLALPRRKVVRTEMHRPLILMGR